MTENLTPDNWYNSNSDWIVPAAGAVVGLASQIGGQRRAKKQQDKQNLFNLEQWNRTNEYNSPQAQMERYQKAGLNPNLIYGSGNSSSGNASPAPEMAKISEVNYQPLETGRAMDSLQSFTDWQVKKAQTDNLKAQTTAQLQNAALTGVRIGNALTEGEQSKFNLGMARRLEQNSYDVASANLRRINADITKTEVDTRFTTNQDRRNEIGTINSTADVIQRIAASRKGMELTDAQIRNLNLDSHLKALDAELADFGIRPSDPWYLKFVNRIMERHKTVQPKSIRQHIMDWLNEDYYKQYWDNVTGYQRAK